ncbi:MAG: integrase family protein, partial [Longimicrobiales bacterium]|nr:integrase family protein [Longimicrobiales bacterium]
MPRAESRRADLSAPFVKNAPPGEHYDGREAGLGLRVSPKGKRAWFLRYRAPGGEQRRYALGEYPALGLSEARAAARDRRAEVSQGADPAARRSLTFEDMAEAALAIIEPQTRPSTVALRRQMLKRDLLPRWRNRPAASIRRDDVAALGREIAARGAKVAANRTIALVRLLYNAGLDLELVEANPAARPGRFLQREAPRERDLTGKELKAIRAAIEKEGPEARTFGELVLATAQRAGAAAGARWAEFDIEGALWTIPAEAGRKFSGHARLVPLNALALAALERLQDVAEEGEEFLFPSRDRSKGPTWTNWQNLNERLRTRSKVKGWSLHTFRSAFRTAATRDLGIPAEVADLVL